MNKRLLRISSVILILGIGIKEDKIWAMHKLKGGLEEAARELGRVFDNAHDHYEEEKKRCWGILNDSNASAAAKAQAQEELKGINARLGATEDVMIGVWSAVGNAVKGSISKEDEDKKQKNRLKELAIEQSIKNEGLIAAEKQQGKNRLKEIKLAGEETRKKIAAFVRIATDPQKRKAFIMLTGGLVTVAAGAYYGIKFLAHVAEDLYRVPALAEKTTILPLYSQLYNWLFNVETFDVTLDDVILTKELEGFFRGFVRSTKNTIENGGYCRHLLLPGPPGTGKTMMSFALANELALPAIYFNAGKLSNCSVEDALVRIEKLFTYAEHSPVPVVIIIDESEVIFKHRNSPDLTEKTRLIMNDIMAKTGTEQNNFILIALTNRPDDFDAAFKSRFSETIYINPPSVDQRKDMLEKYIDQYLINPIFAPKKSWRNLFKKAETKNNKIVIGKDVFSPEVIQDLAQKIDGFSGRDISQMVLGIREEAYAQNNPTVDRELVDTVVARKLEKKRKEVASQKTNAA